MSATLEARGVSRHFGGLVAVHDVSLSVTPNCIHAVIGPNGAGKSTLVRILAGEIAPSSGQLFLGEAEITRTSQQRRSHLGIARSFQHAQLFGTMTALENCRVATQSRAPHAWSWLVASTRYRDQIEAAQAVLATVGLAERANHVAASLSHGEQRQLEIAVALATNPVVLLLDEPLAGMGHNEAQHMIELIGRLASSCAILMVEHDMDAVFSLADVLTVMVDGAVIAHGTPEAVRSNARVQLAYLGEAGALVGPS
jgi:branched-chain amino acid transport system ATP-binding protein